MVGKSGVAGRGMPCSRDDEESWLEDHHPDMMQGNVDD